MTTQEIKEKLNEIICSLNQLQEGTWVQDWTWQQFHMLHGAIENLLDLDESLKEETQEAA